MDWNRVRNILIIVFLIINVVLCAFYYSIKRQEEGIAVQAQKTVIDLLAEDNVVLNIKNIPHRGKAMKSLYIERTIQSEISFIEKIMGEYYIVSEGSYANQNKTLSIVSGVIDFKDATPKDEKINLSVMSNADIERFCVQNIKKYGISLDNTVFKGINTAGENKKAIFTYKYDGYEVLDAYVTVELSVNGIVAIQGKNIIISGYLTDEKIVTVLELNDVLVTFKNNPGINKERKTEIINISQGYYVGSGAEQYKSAIAIPVWQFATDDGKIYYYDARNGSYIE